MPVLIVMIIIVRFYDISMGVIHVVLGHGQLVSINPMPLFPLGK